MPITENTFGSAATSLLLLDAADNVVVVTHRIPPGDTFMLEGQALVAGQLFPLGHKVARSAIADGAKILKYGVPIGVATADIAAGEHVHVHNMRSDYTPTHHLLEEQKEPRS